MPCHSGCTAHRDLFSSLRPPIIFALLISQLLQPLCAERRNMYSWLNHTRAPSDRISKDVLNAMTFEEGSVPTCRNVVLTTQSIGPPWCLLTRRRFGSTQRDWSLMTRRTVLQSFRRLWKVSVGRTELVRHISLLSAHLLSTREVLDGVVRLRHYLAASVMQIRAISARKSPGLREVRLPDHKFRKEHFDKGKPQRLPIFYTKNSSNIRMSFHFILFYFLKIYFKVRHISKIWMI